MNLRHNTAKESPAFMEMGERVFSSPDILYEREPPGVRQPGGGKERHDGTFALHDR